MQKAGMSHATILRNRSHFISVPCRSNRELQKSFCTTAAPVEFLSLFTPSHFPGDRLKLLQAVEATLHCPSTRTLDHSSISLVSLSLRL